MNKTFITLAILFASFLMVIAGLVSRTDHGRPVRVERQVDTIILSQREYRDSLIRQESRKIGVPAEMSLAVGHVEVPNGDPTAVSYAGAVGLMQVMPPSALLARGDSTGAEQRAKLIQRICGEGVPREQLTNPTCNVRVGLHILRDYYNQHRNWNDALRAYNGSLRYRTAGDKYVAAVMERLELE